jgi:L-ascorbate metabolism protein UlaG (beta-lactamase superfamily)
MRLTLVRHATLLIEMAGIRLLVDPMLDPAGARPPVEDSPNQRPNPLVELPVAPERLTDGVDVVVVTHLHADHLDATGGRLIAGLPVLCQPGDEERLRAAGLDARALDGAASVGGVALTRTGGRHGTGRLGDSLGTVSGVVLRAEGEPTVYVAGDTVLCDEVRTVLSEHAPDVVVVNAGEARFVAGDPITMDADGVVGVARLAGEANAGAEVVAVHMEAINHCLLTRAELRARIEAEGLAGRVHVPEDGTALGSAP